MKIYFILDRYVFTKANSKTDEKNIEFDSGYYVKKYDLVFSGDVLQFCQFYREFAIRKFSLHTLILGEMLPFIVIGITKNPQSSKRYLKSSYFDDFKFLQLKNEWNYLTNDLEKLEENIKPNSSLQKAIIWFTLAKLSNTRIDEFMNLYRCLEEFSREFHEKLDEKVNKFVINELQLLNKDIIQKFKRSSRFENIETFLMLRNVEQKKISEIIKFRNYRIAHGQDYKVEFSYDLVTLIDEMQRIAHDIINGKIKEMKIKGLKNTKFLYNYELFIDKSKRKMVLTDKCEIKYLFELSLNDSYLFRWGEIPGNDDDRLIDCLKDIFKVEWAKTENINKIDNGKTIIVSNQEKIISLKLNDEKTKVNLEINGIRLHEFTVITKNDELNIYNNSISSYGLGHIPEKDISSSNMLKIIETDYGIIINKETCNELIKNFGEFIDY